jgi:hypothetical protein
MFFHLLSDLSLSPVGPIPVYNDNKGAIDWSHSFSTKGMRHYNIRENAVREAQQLQEVFGLSFCFRLLPFRFLACMGGC